MNVAVVSLPLTSGHTQEPAGVQLGERADQQGPVGLPVMPGEHANEERRHGHGGQTHCWCVSADLRVDRGTPSLLHSTVTEEDGGGLTRQGSTAVWPTKASTVDGSDLSMVTSPRVKLRERDDARTEGRKEGRAGGGDMGWRIRGGELRMRESLYAPLSWDFYSQSPKASIKIAHNLASEERRDGEKPGWGAERRETRRDRQIQTKVSHQSVERM